MEYIALLLVLVLIVLWIPIYTRRIVDSSLTDNFRAAESIAEGRIPTKWVKEINRGLARKGRAASTTAGKQQALRRAAQLEKFFRRSRFFETEEARQLFFMRLEETRRHWEEMTWEGIVAEGSGEENEKG